MKDIIYRQDAIDALGDIHPLDHNAQAYKARIEKLPSAQIKGGWRIDAEGNVRCTVCNTKCLRDDLGINILSNYCPSCGARLVKQGGVALWQ